MARGLFDRPNRMAPAGFVYTGWRLAHPGWSVFFAFKSRENSRFSAQNSPACFYKLIRDNPRVKSGPYGPQIMPFTYCRKYIPAII